MPVEIRELVIITEINSRNDKPQQCMSQEQQNVLKQQIVQECVKQLRKKQRGHGLER